MYEIVASYSGTINTGNYQNESPFFSIKQIVEEPLSPEQLSGIQNKLNQLCREAFQNEFNRVTKKEEPTDLRRAKIVQMMMDMTKNDIVKAKELFKQFSKKESAKLEGKELLDVYEKVAKAHYEWSKK